LILQLRTCSKSSKSYCKRPKNPFNHKPVGHGPNMSLRTELGNLFLGRFYKDVAPLALRLRQGFGVTGGMRHCWCCGGWSNVDIEGFPGAVELVTCCGWSLLPTQPRPLKDAQARVKAFWLMNRLRERKAAGLSKSKTVRNAASVKQTMGDAACARRQRSTPTKEADGTGQFFGGCRQIRILHAAEVAKLGASSGGASASASALGVA